MKPINVRVALALTVPVEAYAEAYGLSDEEARADAVMHLQNVAREAVAEAVARLGIGAEVR